MSGRNVVMISFYDWQTIVLAYRLGKTLLDMIFPCKVRCYALVARIECIILIFYDGFDLREDLDACSLTLQSANCCFHLTINWKG